MKFGPLEFLVLDNIGAGKMSGHDENEHIKDTGPDNSSTLELRTAINVDVWNAAIEAAAKHCDEMGEEVRISENIRGLKK